MDYNVRRFSFDDGYFWERIGVPYVAFAAIDMMGMDAKEMKAFDLLCFDFSKQGAPTIVAWDFQKSWDEIQVTDAVCDSFDTLLDRLSATPAS